MIISVKRNFLELKNINELIKKDKPEINYSIEKTAPDFQLNKFFYKQIGIDHYWEIDFFGLIKNGLNMFQIKI